jgi:hypothetical protein
MDKDDLVRLCYDWQINNVQYDGWAKKLEKELNKIGLGHIWRNPTENQRGTVRKEVKERCNDIKRQNFFANLSEKRSLTFYRDMKLWDREDYVMCGSRNDRMGIAWFRAGIWKLRDKERFRDWKMPPMQWGGRHDTHSFKMPRNKKAERTPPEQKMADN